MTSLFSSQRPSFLAFFDDVSLALAAAAAGLSGGNTTSSSIHSVAKRASDFICDSSMQGLKRFLESWLPNLCETPIMVVTLVQEQHVGPPPYATVKEAPTLTEPETLKSESSTGIMFLVMAILILLVFISTISCLFVWSGHDRSLLRPVHAYIKKRIYDILLFCLLICTVCYRTCAPMLHPPCEIVDMVLESTTFFIASDMYLFGFKCSWILAAYIPYAGMCIVIMKVVYCMLKTTIKTSIELCSYVLALVLNSAIVLFERTVTYLVRRSYTIFGLLFPHVKVVYKALGHLALPWIEQASLYVLLRDAIVVAAYYSGKHCFSVRSLVFGSAEAQASESAILVSVMSEKNSSNLTREINANEGSLSNSNAELELAIQDFPPNPTYEW